MDPKLHELYQRKGDLVKALRDLQNGVDAEKRDYTAEENQQDDKLAADLQKVVDEITRRERNQNLETRLGTADEARSDEQRGDGATEKKRMTLNEWRAARTGEQHRDSPEYRDAFWHMISAKDVRELTVDELRVLSKASAGAGANLVPTEFQRTLIDALREFGVIRQLANVITTSTGDTIQLPTVTTHGTASWTAENASYTASDEVFGQASLSAYKAATIVIVSEELLTDSAFDLETYIREQFGIRVGVLENTAFVAGDGTGKPTGLLAASGGLSTGKTTAGAAAITADELVDLMHSVIAPYRVRGVWLMKDATVALLRKIKTGISGDTTYVWQPGLQAGVPDTIFGRPVYTDPDMQAATTGLKSVVFGDIKSAYTIRDVDGISFQRLDELYAANGQVGFRGYHRTDGKVVNTAAAKVLLQA